MTICRVFEHPDGSVSVTVPAPASRRMVEHPFERTVRVPASLSVEEHNAAIMSAAEAICKEHPEMVGAELRLEAAAEIVEIDKDGTNILGVTIRVTFLTPEPEDVWLERVFAKTVAPHLVEANHPDAHRGKPVEVTMDDAEVRQMVALPNPLAGLPYRDVDPSTLPPKVAPCQDGCGEEHPIRNLWRMQGKGGKRAPTVDPAVRNLHAEYRHMELAEQHELGQDDPDGGRVALIRATRERLLSGASKAVPPPDLVARLTGDWLDRARKSRV